MSPVRLSIVIPVYKDAQALQGLLRALAPLLDGLTEVIVVDGAGDDESAAVAQRAGCRLIRSAPGRGRQLNAGCRLARGEWLWLLHADTRAPADALAYVRRQQALAWGRFDVAFSQPTPMLRVVALLMNWRSRLTGVCTGDQGMFVHRRLLLAVHGVPELPLMEDVELSSRLKRLSRPLCPSIALETSPRRWMRDGVLRTVLSMWWFRLRYWWGADPTELARAYYGR